MQEGTNDKIKKLFEEINKENNLITYNFEEKKYYINTDIKEILSEKINKEQRQFVELFELYGKWYCENHERIKAIDCYYRCSDIRKILEILGDIEFEEYKKVSQEILIGIIKRINDEEKMIFWKEYLNILLIYIQSIDFNKGISFLRECEEFYNKTNSEEILREVFLMESLFEVEDINKKIEKCRQASLLFKDETSKVINSEILYSLEIDDLIYSFDIHRENLNLECERNIEYFLELDSLCNNALYGVEYIINAQYFFVIGDYKQCEVLAYKALHKSNIKNSLTVRRASYFILIKIYFLFNKDKLNHNIKEIQKIKDNIEVKKLNELINNMNAPTIKLNKESGLISNWTNYLLYSNNLIKHRKFIELEINLDEAKKSVTVKNNIFGCIYVEIFYSILYKNFYKDMDKAMESMNRAIELSKKDRIIMPFIENSLYIIDIIKKNKKQDEYVRSLINKCEEYTSCFESEEKNIELTLREIEVMKLIGKGFKQTEISNELHIALTTVKKHVSSVYDKLGVRNKTLAINILKEKNII